MRKLIVAAIGLGALAVPAQASLVCVTAAEMKVLQSAALQQQLMVAALSCGQHDDYNRFVTAYRPRLLQSDNALKAFFAGKSRGEDYNAYKTRIANVASLKSIRDAKFCDSARKVFDLALGRGGERRGLVPEPPQLIDTGYEGCRNVPGLIEAEAAPLPAARPETKIATAKPAIKPAPVRVAAAAPAPKPVAPPPLAAAPSKPVHVAEIAPKPSPVVAAKPQPRVVDAQPRRVAVLAPKPQPRIAAAKDAPSYPWPDVSEDEDPGRYPSSWRSPDEDQRYGDSEPPRRYAAVERPGWRPADRSARYGRTNDPYEDEYDTAADDQDAYAGDNVPNAYRPGAVWVNGPPSYAGYPPPRPHRPRARLVLGPDGRWMVIIGHQPRWVRAW